MSTTKYKQDLDVTGNITLSGNVTADGNVILGDADTDSITLNADITSNIVPDVTNTYDLGETGKNWRDLFISNDITVGNNVVALQVATLGTLTAGTNLAVGGDANITGNVTASNITSTNASADTLTVVNLVATNINATGAGTQTISAGANIELDATNRVLVTDTPFRLASFTTTTRNAIASPANGDMIYNTTTNQLESYENSAWVATAGSSGGGATAISTAGNTGTGSVTFASETLTATGATGQINVDAAGFALSFSLDADLTGLTSINGHTIPSGSGTLALTSDYADGINVTDESADVTCFPMFGTGATGALTVKTDQSAYKYNASTGALTATSFIGDGSGLTNIPDNTPTFAVTAPDSGRYQFNGAGTDGDDNPTLYLYRGFTYKFAVNSPGHPFHIQTSSGAYNAGNLYTDNVTNPGTQSGTITLTVQMDAPSTLYYVCQYHSAMAGTINIV